MNAQSWRSLDILTWCCSLALARNNQICVSYLSIARGALSGVCFMIQPLRWTGNIERSLQWILPRESTTYIQTNNQFSIETWRVSTYCLTRHWIASWLTSAGLAFSERSWHQRSVLINGWLQKSSMVSSIQRKQMCSASESFFGSLLQGNRPITESTVR